MEYDSYNRITKVTNPDAGNEVVGQYWYDDQGFRVRKLAKRKVAGEDRQVEVLYPSMYFGLEKHRTTSGTEIPNTTYAVNNIYLDGVRIAAVIPNGDARYYFTDQVDSVKVVADDNGRAVTRMEYMPYGETWFTEGDNNNAPKYNSQELDKESNLYYYNARHYDAGIARFVTADTVIDGEYDTQGWNRYAYCHNNPIRYKDPTGHETEEEREAKKLEKAINYVKNENTENVLRDFDLQDKNKDKVAENNVKDNMQKANDKAVQSGGSDNSSKWGSPVEGVTKDNFDSKITTHPSSEHKGLDIDGKMGDRINAAKEGSVKYDAQWKKDENDKIVYKDGKPQVEGYGYNATVTHPDGTKTVYAHLTEGSWKAGKDQYEKKDENGKILNTVNKGDKIGEMGNSGLSKSGSGGDGSHLHFEIRDKNDKPQMNVEKQLKQSLD